MPLDKAGSQSPERRVRTVSQFIQRQTSTYHNQTASHLWVCVRGQVPPSLCVSGFASVKWGNNKASSRVIGRSHQINLQRMLRTEPGTDSEFNASALVTLPASPCAACGGYGWCWGA